VGKAAAADKCLDDDDDETTEDEEEASSSWEDLSQPLAAADAAAADESSSSSSGEDDASLSEQHALQDDEPPPQKLAKAMVSLEDAAKATIASFSDDEDESSSSSSRSRRPVVERRNEGLDWWSESRSFESAEVVEWEEAALQRLHATMTETTLWVQARDRAARGLADEILRRSALGAASVPIALLEHAAALDDPWAIAIHRAKVVGRRLADELLKQLGNDSSKKTAAVHDDRSGYAFFTGGKYSAASSPSSKGPQRPVTLVGYSIGARVVMHCLEALDEYAASDSRALALVENAVLLGAPVAATPKRWLRARRVVAGRLVNGFSKRDWMLRLVYRTKAWSIAGVAGAEPVRARDDDSVAPRVENLDLSDLVNCHLAYPHLMQPIFARLGLES